MNDRRFIAALLVFAAVVHSNAFGQEPIRIQSVGPADARIPIAVPPFVTTPDTAQYTREMAAVVANDLAFTGLFNVLPESQYPGGFTGFTNDPGQINFEVWRGTPAEHLVYATVYRQNGTLVAECRLFDVLVSQQLVGKRLSPPEEKWWRLMAHQFSDEIVRFLTGVPGVATTEICFSVGRQGSKEIYVVDYDGANPTQVTQHNSISIKPKFSPDGTKIAYLSYKDRFPFLYIFERVAGVSTPLSKRSGLNHAPAWAPNGNMLAICLSKDGNTEIYLKDANGTNERRLTEDRAGDTSPSFSPDGSRITFVSDRAGSPQIFAMNADGTGVTRLSYQGGNSYDPVWSPDGQKIAYVVERSGEGLEIYLMNADGSNPVPLTNSPGSNESPTWSPDSRHIAFMSTRDGLPQLYTVTVETGMQRRVPGLSNLRCEGPSWGPRRN